MMNVSNRIRFEDGKLKLGKFGWVRTKPNQTIPNGSIQFVTIKKSKSGKVSATLTIRRSEPIEQFEKTGKEVGIDVGIKSFASFSDGIVIEKPNFVRKDEKKKKRLYRQLSKKKKGSNNRNKQRIKVAKVHEKITNQRNDFLQKQSTMLVSENQTICIEDLNVKGMVRNHKLAQHITSCSWSKFFAMLEYKATWYGNEIIKVPTMYPSSQTCSCCGYKNPLVKNLSVREWECPKCHTRHDRDTNASINILNKGLSVA
jgi:putative transposase